MKSIEVINFFAENYSCRKCFDNPNIQLSGKPFNLADVPGPQPRWLGENYFSAHKKICIMLINPGSGDKTPENEWASLKKLHQAGNQDSRERHWRELMNTNEVGMPKWGAWEKLYFDSLRMRDRIDSIAFMNMMLCASKGNKYNKHSLDLCFSSQSKKLLKLLSPDILIFSGYQTIANAMKKSITLSGMRNIAGTSSREIKPMLIKNDIKDCLSKNTKFYFMGHYAYIKKQDHEDAAIIASSIANLI